jgi:hypothetical protein
LPYPIPVVHSWVKWSELHGGHLGSSPGVPQGAVVPVSVLGVVVVLMFGHGAQAAHRSVLDRYVYAGLAGDKSRSMLPRLPVYQAGDRPARAPPLPAGRDECRFYRVVASSPSPASRLCFSVAAWPARRTGPGEPGMIVHRSEGLADSPLIGRSDGSGRRTAGQPDVPPRAELDTLSIARCNPNIPLPRCHRPHRFRRHRTDRIRWCGGGGY